MEPESNLGCVPDAAASSDEVAESKDETVGLAAVFISASPAGAAGVFAGDAALDTTSPFAVEVASAAGAVLGLAATGSDVAALL